MNVSTKINPNICVRLDGQDNDTYSVSLHDSGQTVRMSEHSSYVAAVRDYLHTIACELALYDDNSPTIEEMYA